MQSQLVATTPLAGLKPLGRPGERDHAQLVSYLAEHPDIGPNAVQLFAEPVPARDGGSIDWYVESDHRPAPVEALDPIRQDAIVDRVRHQLAAIRSEGERLRDAGHPLGNALIAASETPQPLARFLHVLPGGEGGPGDDHAVLVCWAYADDAPRTAGALPRALKPAPLPPPFTPEPLPAVVEPAVMAVPVVEQRRRFSWWWTLWPVLAALLVAIGWLLLPACGIAWFFDREQGFPYCRPAAETMAAEVERGRALQASAHQLEMNVIQSQITCLANRPPPLPKDRWLDKDLSILAGCWTLGRDTQSLVVNDTDKQETCTVHAGTMCFGKDGTGTREQTTDCGTTRFSVCKASIKARFTDAGALETEQPDTKCEPHTITWRSKPNQLTCKRVDEGGAICRDGDNFEHEFRPKANP